MQHSHESHYQTKHYGSTPRTTQYRGFAVKRCSNLSGEEEQDCMNALISAAQRERS